MVSRLDRLKAADPVVFIGGYSRLAQATAGKQPIVVDAFGEPIDGQNYDFIGSPVLYRGHYYASTNPKLPNIGFIDPKRDRSKNPLILPAPVCCSQPGFNHHLTAVVPTNCDYMVKSGPMLA